MSPKGGNHENLCEGAHARCDARDSRSAGCGGNVPMGDEMNEFYVLELGYSDVVGAFESKEEAFSWVERNEGDVDQYVVVQRVKEA